MISSTRRLHKNDGRPLAMLSRRRSAVASRVTSRPSTRATPPSGTSSVARIDSSVVLPAPLGPSRPKMAPRSTCSDTPRSAAVSRRRSQPERNVFVTSWTSMGGGGAGKDDMLVDGNRPRGPAPAGGGSTPADLAPGHTLKFRLECGGRRVHGFLVNHGGEFRAWVNRCPHVGTPLDLWPNEFYTDDGRELICSTHGAIFEPLTGRCTIGPCPGHALRPLPLALEGDALVVRGP